MNTTTAQCPGLHRLGVTVSMNYLSVASRFLGQRGEMQGEREGGLTQGEERDGDGLVSAASL